MAWRYGASRLAAGAVLVLCVLAPGRARAYEDQLTLGFGAGYASALSDLDPRHGVLADVSASVGLDAVWSVRGRASYALHPASEPMHVVLLGGELLYLIDVLEVVPYFGLGLDGLARIRSEAELDAAAHAVLGFDYLVSRDFALELDLRAHLRFTDLDRDPVYLAAVASGVLTFDL